MKPAVAPIYHNYQLERQLKFYCDFERQGDPVLRQYSCLALRLRAPLLGGADGVGAGVRQCAPMKSGLPSSTPLWRRIEYVVVTWKYTFGST